MSHTPDNQTAPDFLPPLRTVKYSRSAGVTAELTALSRQSRSAVLRRAAEAGADRRLRWETLVALTRGFLRAEDTESADTVFVCLVDKMSGAIHGQISGWRSLSADEKENAGDQMVAILCRWVYDLGPAGEFWECNLTTCLERRMADLWRDSVEKKVATVPAVTAGKDGGDDWDRFEQIAGPLDTFAEIEASDLLEIVSKSEPKKAWMLHLRISGFSDEDIAKYLHVTTRTLRNWTHEIRAAYRRNLDP